MSKWDQWSERDLQRDHVGAEFLSKFVELEADVLPVWVLIPPPPPPPPFLSQELEADVLAVWVYRCATANCHAVSPNEGQ